MRLGLASGSAEIVMCTDVVSHRGQSCLTRRTTHHRPRTGHGCLWRGQLTKRPTGGIAAPGEDNSPKGPQGAWLPPERTTHQKAHREHGCLMGRTTCQKRTAWGMAASQGGQPSAQWPTGGKNACNGGAKHVKNASLGGHPSTAHRGQTCL